MIVVRGLKHLDKDFAAPAITIGQFDGVHLGHEALIKQLVKGASERNLPPVVVLFEPQVSEFFLKEKAPARLMRLREKVKALEALGIQKILVLRFNQDLADLTAKSFLQEILLKRLKVQYLVAGDDFRFGQKRKGTPEMLRAAGIEVDQLPKYLVHDERVSSTAIREALEHGKLLLAKDYLGRYFSMSGYVIRGDQRGREFGFPTANIKLHRKKVPVKGIFVVRVKDINGQSYFGAANVGTRPAVGGTHTLLEVHVLDFDQSIYDYYLDVEFIHKLREEEYYETLDLLVEQIRRDVEDTRAFLERHKAVL